MFSAGFNRKGVLVASSRHAPMLMKRSTVTVRVIAPGAIAILNVSFLGAFSHPGAIIQLNVSFSVFFAHPGAMTPMGAELNQIFRPYWGMGATHMHPGAITPIGAILNTTHSGLLTPRYHPLCCK